MCVVNEWRFVDAHIKTFVFVKRHKRNISYLNIYHNAPTHDNDDHEVIDDIVWWLHP